MPARLQDRSGGHPSVLTEQKDSIVVELIQFDTWSRMLITQWRNKNHLLTLTRPQLVQDLSN